MAYTSMWPFAGSRALLGILIVLACHAQARHIGQSGPGKVATKEDTQWLRSRALPADQIYDNAKAKGCRNLEILWGKRDVEPSMFTEEDDFKMNGWIDKIDKKPFPADFDSVFDKLGLSNKTEDNPDYFATHKKAGTYLGVEFSDIEGKFYNRINVKEGVIISINNFSPDYYADDLVRLHRVDARPLVPPLRRFSDILALQWQSASTAYGQGPRKLQWWFRKQVFEGQTLSIMDTVLTERGLTQPPEWPGLEMDIRSGNGSAFLGSPNGNGIAYMLTQHQPMFDARYLVRKVHFFSTRPPDLGYPGHESPIWRHLAFRIVPKVHGMEPILCSEADAVYGDNAAGDDTGNAANTANTANTGDDAGAVDVSLTDAIDAIEEAEAVDVSLTDANNAQNEAGGACDGRSFWGSLLTLFECFGETSEPAKS